MKKLTTLSLAFLLVISLGFGSFPQRASAVIPVSVDADFSATSLLDLVKNTITSVETHLTAVSTALQSEYLTVLNPLATVIARTQLMNQGFNWVRQMAQGIAPGATAGFVTNLAQNFQAVRNGAADSFIQQYLSNGSVTSAQRTLAQNALTDFNRCSGSFLSCHSDTLAQYTQNPEALRSGDIVNGGGLQGLFGLLVAGNSTAQQDQDIRSGLNSTVSGAQENRHLELLIGQGFLGQRASGCGSQGSSNTSATASSSAISLNPVDNLINCAIQTPASIVHDITNHFANSGSIAQSDTHNIGELLTTFLLHMVSQIATRGLSNASAPGSGGTGGTQTGLDTTPGLDSGTGIGTLIDQQIANINAFQSQWQQILNVAQTATATLTNNTACTIALPANPSISSADFLASTVTPTVTNANTQLAKVSPSLTKLNEIKSLAQQGNATSAAQAGQEFNDLFNASTSPFYPSSSDFSYANTQSNTADATSLISLISSANSQCSTAPTS